ncbi:MAG: single-stranded DNA-binding protein [Paludibacteraceae bacterium]|nr:single-stranded DNA-binding protein [Paludibacteraceae bacterium]
MASINKVILLGNVGKDPEIRYVEKDLPVATFSLATSSRYIPKGSTQPIEHTEWHRIVAWRGLAKLAEQYIRRGAPLYIEGKLQTRSWTDQQGAQHSVTEIVANDIQLLAKKQGETAEVPAPANDTAREDIPAYSKNEAPAEDGLPF